MRFSVIIPAYNAERFIDIAIRSVLMQSYSDFELIIVDDGSSDGTQEKIKHYTDSRIRYVYKENGGVSSARNKGISVSKAEYICFLDADDEWKNNHLEVMASLIEKFDQCGMFITGYDIRLNNGQIVHKSKALLRDMPTEQLASDNGFELILKYGYFFNTNTICCKKEVFDKAGLFECGVKNGEDDDMWFRILSYYSLAVTKEPTTIYDRSNCGATRTRLDIYIPVFYRRMDSLLKLPDIPNDRKESIISLAEQNKLSRARKYILTGDKREAKKLVKTIDRKRVNKRKYAETLFCFLIPSSLIRKRIEKRDAGYYR